MLSWDLSGWSNRRMWLRSTRGSLTRVQSICGERTCLLRSRQFLDEYEDVFPKDLPPGLPHICKGHEFKIELKDNALPVH